MKRALLVILTSCGSRPATVAPPPAPPITVLDQAPGDALVLDVGVKRWMCAITWPSGVDDDVLRVPTGRAIRLDIHDSDSVEDLDVELGTAKLHLTRGEHRSLAFRIDRPGSYAWKCPVQQGPGHTERPPILATTASEYEAWLALKAGPHATTLRDKIALGKHVFENKGCVACHTVDGTPRIGISLAGIWGKPAPLADGTTRTVDAAFIADALNMPAKIRRDGYPPSMPSFEGMLKPDEVEALALYIESLK